MDLKPIMRFATEHQKSITMIFVFILLVSALNLVSVVVASRKNKSLNPSSAILVISNGFLAIASTLLLALCVLFLDTSKTLYDSFDGLVSGTEDNHEKRIEKEQGHKFLLYLLSYTSSKKTTSAPSPRRGPSFRILVYPPLRSAYLGAISSKRLLTTVSSNIYAKACLLL